MMVMAPAPSAALPRKSRLSIFRGPEIESIKLADDCRKARAGAL
jgi:hypothetical protein